MDDSLDPLAWKNPRTCAASTPAGPCPRSATVGYTTCARCRAVSLGARFLPGLDLSALREEVAIDVERSLNDATNALDRARARMADAAKVRPTVDVPDPSGDGVRRTFRTAGDGPEGAPEGGAADSPTVGRASPRRLGSFRAAPARHPEAPDAVR